jgi:FkbM family methyltransferase
VTGETGDYTRLAAAVRNLFTEKRALIAQQPIGIQEWVQRKFSCASPKTFLELGAYDGRDTAWLSRIAGVKVHAFEPDPRNNPPELLNVTLHRTAIADFNGEAAFILSKTHSGDPWFQSSSLHPPKNHLTRYPVIFGKPVTVPTITLDTFCSEQRIEQIDFIWCDIQGAEGEMVRGGKRALARTRYLYTEYSDDEMYEGQATLADLMGMLPGWKVVELWPDDLLLENQNCT